MSPRVRTGLLLLGCAVGGVVLGFAVGALIPDSDGSPGLLQIIALQVTIVLAFLAPTGAIAISLLTQLVVRPDPRSSNYDEVRAAISRYRIRVWAAAAAAVGFAAAALPKLIDSVR